MKTSPAVPKDFLGIYIPTYNREKELEECLKSLISQIRKYNFPIFISDNASTDGTKKLVDKIRRIYPNIFYKRNSKNLGFGINFSSVLTMGKTEYAWAFGDDDLIEPGSIDTIVQTLKEGFDFLQINTRLYANDFSRALEDRLIKKTHDTLFNEGEHEKVLLNARLGYAAYLSEIIIRKSLVDQQIRKIGGPKKADPLFPTTLFFFKSIVGKRGKLIASPIIKNRSDNGRLNETALEIWLELYPRALDQLEPQYSHSTLKKAGIFSLKQLVATVNLSRKLYPKNSAIYEKNIMESRLTPQYKMILLMVLKLPRSVVNASVSAVKVFTK